VVAAGIVSEVPLEMKVKPVTESTTVTVSATAEDSAAASTVGGSTVQTAPNITERFDSLLPLVPGVGRRQCPAHQTAECRSGNRAKVASELRFRARVCGADSRFEGQPSLPWPSYSFSVENFKPARDPFSSAVRFLEGALV
jgi:hypothetical protein